MKQRCSNYGYKSICSAKRPSRRGVINTCIRACRAKLLLVAASASESRTGHAATPDPHGEVSAPRRPAPVKRSARRGRAHRAQIRIRPGPLENPGPVEPCDPNRAAGSAFVRPRMARTPSSARRRRRRGSTRGSGTSRWSTGRGTPSSGRPPAVRYRYRYRALVSSVLIYLAAKKRVPSGKVVPNWSHAAAVFQALLLTHSVEPSLQSLVMFSQIRSKEW